MDVNLKGRQTLANKSGMQPTMGSEDRVLVFLMCVDTKNLW